MQKLRTYIRIYLFSIVNRLIQWPLFMRLLNFVYERSSYPIVEYLNRHIVIPNKQFDWSILLYNGKKVVTRIHKDNEKSMHVAFGYQWHDRGLNHIENIMVNYMEANHKQNSVFIDCGANLGMRSITPLSKHLKVVMIEPNDETNQLNLERCRMNNFDNYTLLTFGVSDMDGQKEFYFDSTSYLSTLNFDVAHKEHVSIQEVLTIQVRKLDTIFKDLIGTACKAYIKIDIEGHEIEALNGAAQLINSIAPTFMIEINQKNDHIQKIFSNMTDLGYTIFEKGEPNAANQFLKECPKDVLNHQFTSNDFLFIKDKEVIQLFEPYLLTQSN